MSSQFQNQSGMVLILAILIIAAVLTAAVTFSDLIVREIRQSRLIDQSIQAYYLAESGAERSLSQIRRREAMADCGPHGICLASGYCLTSGDPCVNTDKAGLNFAKGNWQIAVNNEEETSVLLQKGESFQLDLFNPFAVSDSRINQVVITSSVPDLTLYGTFVNLTKILGINKPTCSEQPPVIKGYIDIVAVPPDPPQASVGALDGKTILGECSYSFRLNYPLNIENPSVITLNVYEDGILVPIPSRLVVDSQARFGYSLQQLRVKTPMRPPLSGLYDFVLFSEEKIVK